MTPAAPPARSGHLPALTGLRFFLAIWVIVDHLVGPGHAFEPLIAMLPHPLYLIGRGGYLAVNTFFVLSGFVLARTYGSTKWNGPNVWRYLVGRFARVYPVYLVSLLIVSPFIWIDHSAHKGWLLAMHLGLIQAWFQGHYTVGWNVAAWTLSCEMFFYLTFPLLVVPLRRPSWWRSILTAAIAVVLTKAMWRVGISDNVKPLVHLSDFLMGIAASNVFDLVRARRRPIPGAWLYIPGVLGVMAFIAYPNLIPAGWEVNTMIRPFNAVALIGFGLGGGVLAKALSTRPIVYLGQSSYAMYILHIPILWWAVSWHFPFAPYIYVLFVITVSALMYGYFEEPANRYLRGKVREKKPLVEVAQCAAN